MLFPNTTRIVVLQAIGWNKSAGSCSLVVDAKLLRRSNGADFSKCLLLTLITATTCNECANVPSTRNLVGFSKLKA